MASIRKAKKMGTYVPKKLSKEQRAMYQDTLELASQVNRRIKGLKNAGYQGTWASKKLIKRIDTDVLKGWSSSKGGKVKVQKNLTMTEMKNLQKSMKQFLVSKTSKVKGIEETKEETLKSLKRTLSTDKKMTDSEVETAYEMLSDKSFDYFNKKDRIPASTLWSLIEDAVEYNDSRDLSKKSVYNRSMNKFIKTLQDYMDSEDKDFAINAKALFDKYVL